MSKHGPPANATCPWCQRLFADANGVEQHAKKRHASSYRLNEEERARIAMRKLDRDIKTSKTQTGDA